MKKIYTFLALVLFLGGSLLLAGCDSISLDPTLPTGSDIEEGQEPQVINKYVVTFYVNSTVVDTVEHQVGEVVTFNDLPDIPEVTGYNGYWSLGEIEYTEIQWSKVRANVNVYAYYVAIDYQVVFDVDGGSGVENQKYHYNDVMTAPSTPTKAGYDFVGWRLMTGENEYADSNYVFASMPAENITLKAEWQVATDTIYKVEHYFEDAREGRYTLHETEQFNGTTNSSVSAVAKNYASLGYDAPTESASGVVAADGSLVLSLYYPRAEYTLIYDTNGGSSITSTTARYGTRVYNPGIPTKVGYTFAGWFADDTLETAYTFATMPLNGATIYAKWTAKTNVVYVVNHYIQLLDESYALKTAQKFYNGTADASKTVYPNSYTGYTVTESSQTITVAADGTSVVNFYYNLNSYTITFDCNGGSAISVTTLKYGQEIDINAPTRSGYRFVGWSPKLPSVMPANDLEVTALWSAIGGISYQVLHYQEGLDGTYTLKDTDNLAGITNSSVTAVAKVYTGFSENTSHASRVATGTVAGDGSLVLKLYYDRLSYTITFETVGGTSISAITQDFGSNVTAPSDPTKTGYTFSGWDKTIPATMPAGNMTITALWDINSYTITFDTDGGTSVSPISQDYNTDVIAPSDPTKTGYTFSGWDVTIPAKMPAGNMTITALWDINSYTITFDTDGGTSVSPISQDYNTDVIAPSDPTKTGYTFSGWDVTIPTTMPAGNMTITALWDINSYTITFDTDGGTSVSPISQDYNTDVIAPSDPTKTGYTFSGWDVTIPAKMPAGNMTITALWDINSYTITFDTDGGTSVSPISQDYNTDVIAPSDPTKTGYTFSGWDVTVPAKMPAGNMTITAIWDIAAPILVSSVFDNDVYASATSIQRNYNGNAISLSIAVSNEVSSLAYTYQWYKDNVAITGATTDEYVVGSDVINANYKVIVTATNNSYDPVAVSSTSGTLYVRINQATPIINTAPTASAIVYGQTLAGSTLTGGTANVAGSFAWANSLAAPTVEQSGNTHSVVFTPSDATNYTTTTCAVSVVVNSAVVSITTIPTASAINYGKTLADSTLTGGVASVDGTFTWANSSLLPTVANSNLTEYTVNFTPTNSNYQSTTCVVKLVINKATPVILTSPSASAITYGQLLANSTLTGGSANVAGSFTWKVTSTAPNAAPSGAFYAVTFTPADTDNYNTTETNVSVVINKKAVEITTNPVASAISYGQSLASSVLSGGAVANSVAGAFTWDDSTIVPVMADSETTDYTVAYVPTDTDNYASSTCTVKVKVNKLTPTISLNPSASAITYPQTLASSTLTGGVNSVSGTYAWANSSIMPTVSDSNSTLYQIIFTPNDTSIYNTVTITIKVTVSKGTPVITTEPTASAISYNETLADSTLSGGIAKISASAETSMLGSFAWEDATTVMTNISTTNSCSVVFTPNDVNNYNTVTFNVNVEVGKATPSITTNPTAAAIFEGDTLADSVISGGVVAGSIAGTFAWTTATTTPVVSNSNSYEITFTPTDNEHYNSVTMNVVVNVIELLTIAETKELADESAIAIKGIVTAVSSVSGKRLALIQDATSAMYVYNYNSTDAGKYVVGNELIMSGVLDIYSGLYEIKTTANVRVESTGNAVPSVVDVTSSVGDSTALEAYQSQLVEITATFVSGTIAGKSLTFKVGTNNIVVRISTDWQASFNITSLVVDASYTVTGYMNWYNGAQITPISNDGIQCNESDASIVAFDKAALEASLTISGNVTAYANNLPLVGSEFGSAISWSSNNTTYFAVDNSTGAVTVNRHETVNQAVTLTATITQGEESDTVVYNFNVAAILVKFTVTYDANSGTGTLTDSNEYIEGASVTVLDSTFTAPAGKQFGGFTTNSDGTGDHYNEDDIFEITDNITLYALWEPEGLTKATITFSEKVSTASAVEALFAAAGFTVDATMTSTSANSGDLTGIRLGTSSVIGSVLLVFSDVTITKITINVNPWHGSGNASGSITNAYFTMNNNSETTFLEATLVSADNTSLSTTNFTGSTVLIATTSNGKRGFINSIEVEYIGKTDAEKVAEDKDAIVAPTTPTTSDFVLPVSGSNGSTITWSSNDTAIAISGANATVTRPASSGSDATVTLTATITLNDETDTRQFTVVVTKEVATYTVTYNANTGTGTMTDTNSPYVEGSTPTVLANNFTAPDSKVFKEWNTQADGNGTSYDPLDTLASMNANVTLYAIWEAGEVTTYTVTYDANTGTGTMTDTNSPYVAGSTPTVLANSFTAPLGKVFKEWNTQADGNGTTYAPAAALSLMNADVTLYAIWQNTYTVSYDANAGTGTMTDSNSPYVEGSTPTILANNFTAPGDKVFKEWNTASDGTGTSYAPAATLPAMDANVTLYAIWDALVYSIDFENANGFTAGSTYNNATEAATGPTGKQWKTYYGTPATTGAISDSQSMQMRWYTSATANLGYTYTDFTISAVQMVKFTAANTNGLNVQLLYSTDGGSNWLDCQTYTLTTSAAEYVYYFSSVAENVMLKFQMVLPATNPTGTSRLYIDDIEVYCEADVDFYAVTYAANTGTGTMTDSNSPYATNSTAVVLANGFTAPEGKVFKEWNTQADGNGTSYAPAATLPEMNADVTLYAIWQDTYTVTYNANTGTGTMTDANSPYVEGSTPTVLANNFTAPEGKVFREWNTQADGNGTSYAPAATLPAMNANVTLYAIWEVGETTTYTVAYDANTGTGSMTDSNSPYVEGSTPTVLANGFTAPTSKEFDHWNTEADESGTSYNPDDTLPTLNSDITLYAIWKNVSITFTISSFDAGTQYAENEEHVINDRLTITTTQCHFTSELRMYSSSSHDGFFTTNVMNANIKKITFNAGNKADVLVVYGSNDGINWIEVGEVSTTSAYANVSIDFGENNYKAFKVDVKGTNQVRIKSITIEFKAN